MDTLILTLLGSLPRAPTLLMLSEVSLTEIWEEHGPPLRYYMLSDRSCVSCTSFRPLRKMSYACCTLIGSMSWSIIHDLLKVSLGNCNVFSMHNCCPLLQEQALQYYFSRFLDLIQWFFTEEYSGKTWHSKSSRYCTGNAAATSVITFFLFCMILFSHFMKDDPILLISLTGPGRSNGGTGNH